MRIGFFHQDEIEEIRDPTRDSLEKKLKYIEQKIEDQGREHSLNTFVLVFYSGEAHLNEDRKIQIRLVKEAGEPDIINYNLEERMLSVNQGRFIYTMAIFDSPRKLVNRRKKKPAAIAEFKPTPTAPQKEEEKQEDVITNSIMVYACAVDETEKRDLAFDLPAHWQARQVTRARHPNIIVFKDDIKDFPDIALLSETKVTLKCDLGKFTVTKFK